MSTAAFLAICIAFGFSVYVTILFVRDLRTGRDSFLRKFRRWIRNLIDTLFGLG
jgi:hypothetical protein